MARDGAQARGLRPLKRASSGPNRRRRHATFEQRIAKARPPVERGLRRRALAAIAPNRTRYARAQARDGLRRRPTRAMTPPLRVNRVRRCDGDVSHIGVSSGFLPSIPIAMARAVLELRSGSGAYFVVDPAGVHRQLALGANGDLVVEPDLRRLFDIQWLPDFEPGTVPEWAFRD